MNDLFTLLALILSLASFLYILIVEFLLPGRIIASFSQYLITRVPHGNREKVGTAAIEMDFMSSQRSDWANSLVKLNTNLPALAQTNKQEFRNQLNQILESNKITSFFRKEIILDLAKQTGFGTSFGIPLSIVNIGYKPIFISRISLKTISKNKEEFWFDSFVSINLLKLMKRNGNQTDVDRYENIFTGKWVAAKQTIEICPLFILRSEGNNIIWTKKNITFGKHKARVYFYNDEGKEIYSTKIFELNYTSDNAIETFNGSDISNILTPF
jgi:hypothetical protein